ncbi:MAG: hypothetical protein EZS28_015202 [Streblomastix strix]|uniref:Uncharacterized protein n=1 Tax=Streblomastix strix TaxID=222440 RepID=A0A5J4W2W7_9EUKA|nr:MAG: hypothetical protein EZS28_015202 [Streblomastix strix]
MTPKAIEPVQDPRIRYKDLTTRTRQRQHPTPRLTSRISWTEEERDQERMKGRNFENRKNGNDNEYVQNKN